MEWLLLASSASVCFRNSTRKTLGCHDLSRSALHINPQCGTAGAFFFLHMTLISRYENRALVSILMVESHSHSVWFLYLPTVAPARLKPVPRPAGHKKTYLFWMYSRAGFFFFSKTPPEFSWSLCDSCGVTPGSDLETLEVIYIQALVLFFSLLGQNCNCIKCVPSIKEVQRVRLFLIVPPLNRMTPPFEVFVVLGAAQGATGRGGLLDKVSLHCQHLKRYQSLLFPFLWKKKPQQNKTALMFSISRQARRTFDSFSQYVSDSKKKDCRSLIPYVESCRGADMFSSLSSRHPGDVFSSRSHRGVCQGLTGWCFVFGNLSYCRSYCVTEESDYLIK